MPDEDLDPSSLEGDDLESWYRRSPSQVEQERQAAAQQRYDAFFGQPSDDAFVDREGAGPEDGAQLIAVGNPFNPRLRRQWEKLNDRFWPRTKTGRNYDVAHIKALADGGTNTVDNIRPMHPAEHLAQHMADGDLTRWARRQWIAKAFGGRVLRGLGPLSDFLGILTGDLDPFDPNSAYNYLVGAPSAKQQRALEEQFQKQQNPNWKPGDPPVI